MDPVPGVRSTVSVAAPAAAEKVKKSASPVAWMFPTARSSVRVGSAASGAPTSGVAVAVELPWSSGRRASLPRMMRRSSCSWLAFRYSPLDHWLIGL
jgi:hypothetical protein